MGSLKQQTYEILERHDPNVATSWLVYFPLIHDAVEQETERQAINYFLRTQLGLLSVDTTQARRCLNDVDPMRYWLKNFEELIAPLIAEHGLPVWQGRAR